MYDDGDADESIQFRKYEVVKKNGSVDLVTVLQHNLDDLDMIPASTSAVPKVMEEQGNIPVVPLDHQYLSVFMIYTCSSVNAEAADSKETIIIAPLL